jgi:hypothetical protein
LKNRNILAILTLSLKDSITRNILAQTKEVFLSEPKWEAYFKPEARSSGLTYFENDKVYFSMPSDTEVLAYIKGAGSYKITIKTESMQSQLLTADCNCTAAKKGQFCKHIWATLLMTESKRPEFLEDKTELQMKTPASEPKGRSILSETQLAAKENFKAKQADYRKVQYQKQKQRLLLQKQSKNKNSKNQPNFPNDVSQALNYFSENGFPMETSLSAENIQLAKKKLSRVFHPDKGGKHTEILELNKNFDILMRFIGA